MQPLKPRCLLLLTVFVLLSMIACASSPEPTVTPVTVTPTDSPVSAEATQKEPAPTDTLPAETEETSGVIFSQEGGFYDQAFTLTLSSQTGREIYYTTDGSNPCSSETAILYTDGISVYDNTETPNIYAAIKDISLSEYWPPANNIDKCIVIRAVEKNSDGTYGKISTQSYFVNKTKDYYSDFHVISMVTEPGYLFDPDTGAYMVGSGYYEWEQSKDYMEFHESDTQNPTNYNRDGKESEFPVTIQVFKNGSSVYSENVGARISGNWTRSSYQKSFRLYARKEYGSSKMNYAFFDELTDINGELIQKFDKVTLRNGGNDQTLHFRDAFIHDLAKDLHLDIMAFEPYILFINGEFWGFYLLREKPEDYYIQSHYGIDDKEVAVIKNNDLDSGTEEDLEEYRQFTIWAATADMTKEENYKEFCEKMDVQSFMDYMAVETYVVNNDWAAGYLNNWMVWRSKTVNPEKTYADGKWRFILYDLDFSSALYGGENTSYQWDLLGQMYSYDADFSFPRILQNLCKNEKFRQAFYDNYVQMIETTFAPDRVSTLLDTYAATYGNAVKDTHHRFGMDWAADYFDAELENLRTFYTKRPTYAKYYLDLYCGRQAEVPEELLPSPTPTPTPELSETDADANAFGNNLVPNVSEWYAYGPATMQQNTASNSYSVNVSAKPSYSWDIQTGVSGLSIKQNAFYRLSFEASCSNPVVLEACIFRWNGSEYPTVELISEELTNELTSYTCYFTFPMEDHDSWELSFRYGNGEGEFVVQNVSLQELISMEAVHGENMIPNVSKWYYYGDATFLPDAKSNTFTIDVPAKAENPWDIRAYVPSLSLEQAASYLLSFDASCTEPCVMEVFHQRFDGTDYPYFGILDSELTKEPIQYKAVYTFTAENHSDWELCFNLGLGAGKYEIKNVKLIRLD